MYVYWTGLTESVDFPAPVALVSRLDRSPVRCTKSHDCLSIASIHVSNDRLSELRFRRSSLAPSPGECSMPGNRVSGSHSGSGKGSFRACSPIFREMSFDESHGAPFICVAASTGVQIDA